MSSLARLVVTAAVISLLMTPDVLAQEPRVRVTIKGGASAENSEDGLTGTAGAFGGAVSIAFARAWRGEFEVWVPGYLEDVNGDPKHRDVLFSFSAIRGFGGGRVRPFVAAGVSVSQTQDWFTFCAANREAQPGGPLVPTVVSCDEPDVFARTRERNDGTDLYLAAGGGVEFRVAKRVSLVADLRLSLAPVSVLVRPSLGVAFLF